jgi:hypothetical protein
MAILHSNTTIGGSQVISAANMVDHGVITTSNIGSQSVNYAGSAGYTPTISLTSLGSGSVNVNNGSSAVYRTETGNGAAVAYAPLLHLGGGDTMWQIQGTYGASGNGILYFRQGYAGSWGTWLTMLSSANYNSYSPTLTGGGASGTWGIDITGTAGSASSVAWTNVSGRPTALSQFTNDTGFITSTGRAYPRRADGTNINFYWSGQSGQPSWLWGSNDGVNFYVWNPSNFSVNYASSAGSATTAAYFPTLYNGGVQSNPQTYFGQSVGLRVAMTGVPFAWCDTLWINGYSGGDVLSMCAIHTARNGQPRMWISTQTSTGSSYGTTYEVVTEWNSPYALNMNQYVRTSDSPTFAGLSTTGNTNLGDGNGDVTHINDTLHVGATDSGDAHFYFGEGSTGSIQYGSYWYWDSSYGFYWYGRNEGSNSLVMQFETNNLGYVNWHKPFNMQNNEINYLNQVHFYDNVRFYDDGNDRYLNFKWGNATAGGIMFWDGNGSRKGYVYGDGASFGLLDSAGSWKVRVDTGAVELYGTVYLPTTYVGYIYDRDNSGYYIDMNGTSNLYSLTLSGNTHFYPNSWIQLDGSYGLYAPTNNAHFYPNNGTYGSWKSVGSRGGWSGIEFEANNGNVVLMVNPSSNTVGFHNNAYGWQFYWEGGTLYCFKNSYGAGTQATVLDSSNYTTWVPTKTGSGASGTWGIDISGTATYATSAPGYVKGNEWFGSTYIGGGEIYSPIFYDANDSYWRLDPSDYSRYNSADINRVHNYGWYTNSQWGDSAMINIGSDSDPAYPIQGSTNRWDITVYTNSGQIWGLAFVNSSDIRIKENVQNITSGLDIIKSLQPVTYNLLNDAKKKTKAGLIAQEVEPILDHVVTTTYEAETFGDIKGIDYIQLVPYLIQAIKEQNALIEDLTQRIANLENQ